MPGYAQVIVDIGHANVDKIFDYRIPEGMELVMGHRVSVPFGKGSYPIEGFVVGVAKESAVPENQIKDVLRILEQPPALLKQQIKLALWMQRRYRSLLVEALRLMIPAPLRGGRVKAKTLRLIQLNIQSEAVEAYIASEITAANGEIRAPRQAEILRLMAQTHEMLSRDILELYPQSSGALKALIQKGVLKESATHIRRKPYLAISSAQNAPDFILTAAQDKALSAITGGLKTRSGSYLLHGVTGSGKTEVYMRAIAQCLKDGRQAIMLVSEISLTPQAIARLRERFGGNVAVLHSRLSAGERYDEWRRIRNGDVQLALGARSAIFAPFENLGLIVLDEEHEMTYRSNTAPRYTAYEVAGWRCAHEGAVLVMGSATPSIPTYYAAKTGKHMLLELPDRARDARLPRVQIVDMRTEIKKGNRTIFSHTLRSHMQRCLKRNEQIMLFLNRRGYATFVSCRGCGYVMQCDHCDVSMIYHQKQNVLRCHYCGREQTPTKICPLCQKPYLKYFGVGTQQVEQAVKQEFPGVSVLRMDTDTTQTKDAHYRILKSFENHEAQILIGTQMIAKGHDFANVTLVGVVAADASLFLPDYTSSERTFQLLTQVAGRAGRADKQGNVVIQTYSPDHPGVRFAAKQDYKGFYAHEIELREKAQFPPFSSFVRVLFSGEDAQSVIDQSAQYNKEAQEALGALCKEARIKSKEIVGMYAYSKAPISRINGKTRYQVLLKLLPHIQREQVVERLHMLLQQYKRTDILCILEIDPQNML